MLKPVAAIIALALSVSAQADPHLQRLLADSAKAGHSGFERTMRAELRANPSKEPALVVDRYIPGAGTTGRWELVSVDGRSPTEQEIAAHAKGNRNPPGFHNLHRMLSAPPSRRTETDGQTVFHWDSLPKGAVQTPGGDISGNLSADLATRIVDGKMLPQQFRVYAAKPFNVRLVAKINRFNIVSDYVRGSNGQPFLAAQTSDMDVNAPMGLGGKRRNNMRFKPL